MEDEKPFTQESRFLRGIKGSISNIVTNNADLLVGAGAATILGALPFNFGGLVPGRGNADTVNAKLTPGEFVVPKDTVDSFGSNFFRGLTQTSQPETNSYSSSIQYSTRGNMETGEIEIDPSSLEPGVPIEAAQQDYYMGKIKKLQFQIRNKKRQFGDDYDTSYMEGELKEFNDKYNSTLEFGGIDYTNIGKNEEKKESKFGNFVKSGGIFGAIGRMFGGDKKNENVKNDDKNVKFNTYDDYDDDFSDPFFDDGVGFDELINDDSTVKSEDKRGLLGAMGGTIDAVTGNLTDFDRRGGKPSGLMRGITGTIDAATGGLTDLDRRGGKPFGLMRGITGSIDAMTGGLTDLDRRGGKPFGLMRGLTGSIDAMTGGLTDLDRRGGKPSGTMRIATGVADAMTRNLFDFDRRGDGKEKKLPPSQDPSHPMYQKIQELKNKRDQLEMKTTVNPDGSITSKGSGTFIAGEIVRPGEPLSPKQRAAITMGIQMGNTYSSEIMENYNNSGGSPSKEEFDNYEREKSKDIRPEEEKSKNITPERTLGEKVLNRFSFLPGINKSEKTEKMKIAGEMQDVEIGDDGFPTEDAIEKMTQGMGRKSDKKPQGLMRSITGIADHMTRGLTDFDKRGKGIFNPFSSIGSDKNVKLDKSTRPIPQNVTQPLDDEDETVILPPLSSPTSPPVETPSPAIPPSFGRSNNTTTAVGETDSSIPYIDVISNHYLSIP